jgi:hypothetical protein
VSHHWEDPDSVSGVTWFYTPSLATWADQPVDIDVVTDFAAPWELTVTNGPFARQALPIKISGHGGEQSPPFEVNGNVRVTVTLTWPMDIIDECSGPIICTEVFAHFFVEPIDRAPTNVMVYALGPDPPWAGERETLEDLVMTNERGLWVMRGPDELNWSAVIEAVP